MNFKEFYEQVEKMKYELQEQSINLEEVTILSVVSRKLHLWAEKDGKIIYSIRGDVE